MTTKNAVGNSLTGSTGSGSFVGATSPTLVTPVLGTPTSGNLKNCTSETYVYVNNTSAQTGIVRLTFTKLTLNNELADQNSNFDSSTNYRFTPTIAGKYFCVANVLFDSITDQNAVLISLYKNGSNLLQAINLAAATTNVPASISAIIDMNGSTDYIEVYVYHTDSSNRSTVAGGQYNWFQAIKVG